MAAYKPIRIGDSVPLQQINPSTETIDGKIQVTQTGVVLGRITAGAGGHEEIPFANIPGIGGGGGASYTEITYADMATALAGGTLTPGGWYLITDAAGTDLGFLTYAVKANEISPAGVGGYLNADFQAVGDYSGVAAITGQAAGTQQGIWRTSFEAVTINYVGLEGGAFSVGDTITGGTTLATAVILTDDGVSSMTAYMTSAGVAFDGSEVLDNGSGVTADMDGAASAPTIAQGDVVIWNLLHWQLTDSGLIDGTDPATNVAAYTQLLKTDAGQGYITAWDVSEFDFINNAVKYREDENGNVIRTASMSGIPFGNDAFSGNFIFGNSFVSIANFLGGCGSNFIVSGAIYNIQGAAGSYINNCTLYSGSSISELILGSDTAIENNILENGAQLTGITAGANCQISRNTIGKNSVFGGSFVMGNDCLVNANTIYSNCEIGTNTNIGDNSSFSNNTISAAVFIDGISCITFALIDNNIIENSGQLIGISCGNNCSISRNKIGQGATLGGTTTMGDGAAMNDNTLEASASMGEFLSGGGCQISYNTVKVNSAFLRDFTIGENSNINSNTIGVDITVVDKTVGDSVEIALNVIDVEIYGTGTLDSFIRNSAKYGFSDFPGTIDITGLTALDCTVEWAQYRSIYNLTSTNATEAIDTITNPPTLFPFTLRPAAGLVLTVTGTAYAGIAAGQIALKAASYTLDGDKGEYIVLEIDPLGTGALIEKQVVNGLI